MKSLLQLKKYFVRYRVRLALGLLFVLLSNLTAVCVPLLIKDGINGIVAGAPIGKMALLAGAIAGVAVLSGVFRFYIRETLIVMSRLIEYDLRQDLWEHVQRLPLSFFRRRGTGDIMAHLTNDVNAVRSVLGPVIMYSVDNLSRFFFILALMLYHSPRLTLCGLLPLPLLSILMYFLAKAVHSRFTAIQEAFADLTARAQQDVAGIRVVKSYVREDFQDEAWAEASRDYLEKQMSLVRVYALFRPLLYLIPGSAMVMTLWVGGRMVMTGSGGVDLGTLVAFLVYMALLIWPMMSFGWVVSFMQRGAASMARLNNLMAEPPDIADGDETDRAITDVVGAIEFRGVSFRYQEHLPPVLHDVNLSVPAGATLAIVGPTGCGKSALANLIPRLYDCTDGEILIDGANLETIPLEVLRRHIGMATQDSFLFSDTMLRNIGFGLDDCPPDRLFAAAGVAQIAKDVATFPDGYETLVGERGVALSGGQQQRTCLARALAMDPRILILDDTFSAIDVNTEQDILEGLGEVLAGRTAVLISHRISSVMAADNIVVLDEGRIVEQGAHQALLEHDGLYADLYRKQQLESEIERLA